MPTVVALSAAETRLLQTLRDQPLDSLTTDGWAIYLHSGARTLAFVPEESDGPDDVLLPDADVVRVRIEAHGPGAHPASCTELGGGLGRILHVARMTTRVAFRLPGPGGDDAPAPEPAHEGVEAPLYFHPDQSAPAAGAPGEGLASSLVDVGVALEAERGWAVLATDGWGFRVFAALASNLEERLAPLTGKVRVDPLFTLPVRTA